MTPPVPSTAAHVVDDPAPRRVGAISRAIAARFVGATVRGLSLVVLSVLVVWPTHRVAAYASTRSPTEGPPAPPTSDDVAALVSGHVERIVSTTCDAVFGGSSWCWNSWTITRIEPVPITELFDALW